MYNSYSFAQKVIYVMNEGKNIHWDYVDKNPLIGDT